MLFNWTRIIFKLNERVLQMLKVRSIPNFFVLRKKKSRLLPTFIAMMVPKIGLEPTTYWLQVSCSTNWAISAFQWWRMTGSNRRPSACKADALPTELILHISPATSYSRTNVLPSAIKCLTSVFGMGTGVSTFPSSPGLQKILYHLKKSFQVKN